MALAVDKNGKVYNKKLNMSEDEIRKIMSNSDKEHHKKLLKRALSIKINRKMIS